jgi:hypothetical protein
MFEVLFVELVILFVATDEPFADGFVPFPAVVDEMLFGAVIDVLFCEFVFVFADVFELLVTVVLKDWVRLTIKASHLAVIWALQGSHVLIP